MGMDKETKEALRKFGIAHTDLKEIVEKQGQELQEIRGNFATMKEDPENSTSTNSSQESDKATADLEDKVAHLEERNKYLESEKYQEDVIEEFVRNMDVDNFNTIGLKRGFLESSEPDDAELQALEDGGIAEVPLEDNKIMRISKEKPEDPDNWEYSATQGLYIQVV